MQYQIRALGIGEVLDTGLQLLKNHFGILLAIMGVTILPVALISGILLMDFMQKLQVMITTKQFEISPVMIGVIIAINLVYLLIIQPLANAASIYAISSAYMSQKITLGEALRHGASRLPALIGTSILVWLAIAGGFLLCALLAAASGSPGLIFLGMLLLIVPGIFPFVFWYALYQHVVVLEGSSGGTALSRSKTLMKGNWGALFVVGLILGIISMAIGQIAQLMQQLYVNMAVSTVLNIALSAFGTACFVAFYFSCRCQHENFDLQILADAIDEDVPAVQ
jgi:hypothetical protein